MKRILRRITAVVTAIALLVMVESVLGVRIYGNKVFAAEQGSEAETIVSMEPVESEVPVESEEPIGSEIPVESEVPVKPETPVEYSNLDMVKDDYEPTEPVQAVEEKEQEPFQNTNIVIKDVSSQSFTTAISVVIGNTTEELDKLAEGIFADRGNLIAEAATKEAEATTLSRIFPENYTPEKVNKLLSESSDARAQAAIYQTNGTRVNMVSGALKVVSVGLDAYSIVNDIQGLQDLQHEHSSLRALETTLLVADGTLAAVSILSTTGVIAVGSLATPLLVAGIVVGLTSSFVHSEGFANYMNSMDGSVLDFFDNLIESMFPWMKTPDGVNCYKPNIYIYDSEGRRIELVFTEPQLIITSIPDYASGWTVTASKDSTLLTDAGETFTYLFYESVTVRGLFETESGFMISSENRKDEWNEILSAYGFNETEIGDFVEFWDEMLESDKDYIMYPQYTETVDKAMEISISPMPENIVRMWFVFEEYHGQQYEEEKIVSFTREGYTVVEWGGMIF